MDWSWLSVVLEFLRDSWITYLLALVGFVVGLAKFLDALRSIHKHWSEYLERRSGRKLSDADLKNNSKSLAQEIIDFIAERHRTEPQIDFSSFQVSTEQLMRHSTETQNIYARDFAGRVLFLRKELEKVGLTNEDVDRFSPHPTNELGLRALAIGLAALSEELP